MKSIKSTAYFLVKMAFIASVAYMVACTTQSRKEVGVQQDTSYQSTQGIAANQEASQKANENGQAVYKNYTKQDLLNLKTFYFDFDKSDLSELAVNSLPYHAELVKTKIAENPKFTLVLEGHTDERGTSEYNIALGSRRADAVSRFLRVNGVPADSIRTVSYGEERPAALGHSEESWSKNRRVELVY